MYVCLHIPITVATNPLTPKPMNNQFQKVAHDEACIDTLIGMFLNRQGYSDTHPIGLVEGTIGKRTLLVRVVKTTTEWPINKEELKWEVGGFSGYCSNSFNQKWEFELTDQFVKIRVTKKDYAIYADNSPSRYYDYNF